MREEDREPRVALAWRVAERARLGVTPRGGRPPAARTGLAAALALTEMGCAAICDDGSDGRR